MMDEQNISGNVPSAQPGARETSLKDVYREPNAEHRREQEEEPEEETGETRGKRPRVSRLERLQQKSMS